MVGEKNAYWCPTCKGYVVTIDRDKGVTPFMLACRVGGFEPGSVEKANFDGGCTGMMQSMFYPPEPWPPQDGHGRDIPTEPEWEWVAPSRSEVKRARREGIPIDRLTLNLRRIANAS